MNTGFKTLRDWLKSECKLDYSISELKNLTRLDLSLNNLTQIPSEIADLKLDYFDCDKIFVKESDKKMIKFLDKFEQKYHIVQETLLTEVLF